MSDFGSTFANGGRGVPNPYGPILICISPEALLEATDVAISLKSAGKANFSREREALNLDEVEKLFVYPASSSRSAWVKFSDRLREEFDDPEATSPEISCTYAKGKIPLECIQKVIVDPYVVNKMPLVEWVRALIEHLNVQVSERSHDGAKWYTRKPLYDKLALAISEGKAVSEGHPFTLRNLLDRHDTDEAIRIWAGDIESLNLAYQFKRYANYLHKGTLQYLIRAGNV